MKRAIAAIIAFVALVAIGAGIFVFSGQYDVGADEPHWAVTESMLRIARDRSIEASARAIDVPALVSPEQVARGAQEYAAMCAGCHLSPLSRDSETRKGLNPQPPDFYRTRVSPQRAFWVTKHGLKMTGMPAWGRTHDDATIWSLVAFLQKMPELDADRYRALAAPEGGAPAAHEHPHSGHH